MKIHYLGHFGGYDGLSKSARDYVEMLVRQGHDVYPETIDNRHQISAFGKEWEAFIAKKPLNQYDVAIVHVTPVGNEKVLEIPAFKNAKRRLWMTIFETNRWPSEWLPAFQGFDGIITNSLWQVRAAENAFQTQMGMPEIYYVPHIVLPIANKPPKIKNEDYTFYSEFSSIIHRKGLDILLKAYFNAFTKDDKVLLRIKIPNRLEELREFLDEVRKARACFIWKENNLPKISYIRAYLSDKEMDDLMLSADCYVCSARGEGFSLPLAKAGVNGIKTLWPAIDSCVWGGDYLNNGEYEAISESVFTDNFSRFGFKINTDNMYWLNPSIADLSFRMGWCVKLKSKAEKENSDYAISQLSEERVYNQFKLALGETE